VNIKEKNYAGTVHMSDLFYKTMISEYYEKIKIY